MNVERLVVKVGGSLLDCDDVWSRLTRWLRRHKEQELILVCGGGDAVDAIRTHDRLTPGEPVVVHWHCVELMRLNALRMLDELRRLPMSVETQLVRCNDLADRVTGRWMVLDPWQFLQIDDRRHPTPLPESWDVTSDSIAARVAEVCRADGLILLKSALPAMTTYASCAAAEFVDAYFAEAARNLSRVEVVNLRDDTFPVRRLTCGD